MSQRPQHSIVTAFAAIVAMAVVLALAPASSHAASYWVSLDASDGEIAQGVNGFDWLTYGGSWDIYGSHCDARTGVRFVAGSYCVLRFNVPPGLTAGSNGPSGGGDMYGDYRVGTTGFALRTSRPGANPSYTSDEDRQVATHGQFHHGWGALGTYLETGIRAADVATTGGTINTWFDIDKFTVVLHDPTAPAIQSVAVGGTRAGWNGPGCNPVTYTWGDVGSQLNTVRLIDVATESSVHRWAAEPAMDVVTTGVPTFSATPCISSAISGRRTYRSEAYDLAGNAAVHSFEVYFDVTPPSIGAATVNGSVISDGRVFGSAQSRPVITVPVVDTHSGLESVSATLDGASLPAHFDGAVLTIAPAAQLPLGTHQIAVRAIDRVGLAHTLTRTIKVVDDAPPVIQQHRDFIPAVGTPVLDVAARDDRGGVVAASWRVTVDGAPVVPAAGTDGGLELGLGRVVDGTHDIVVSVTDASGNVGRLALTHVADESYSVPQLTGARLTGIHVYDAPSSSAPGDTHRVRAVVARHGRPVSGRAELRSANATVGFREIGVDGTVDLGVTINAVRTDLAVHAPDGAGLDPVAFSVACPRCASEDPRPVQPSVDSAGNGTVGPTSNSPQPVSPSQASALGLPGAAGAAACAAAPAACVGPYPRNVIYYVGSVPYWNGIPLAESGASLDKVAPVWKLVAVKRRSGVTKRSRSLALRLWTNEISVLSITPVGAKQVASVGVRRKWRTILVKWSAKSTLASRVSRARAGSVIVVRLRVVATDRNGNSSKPRVISIRATV